MRFHFLSLSGKVNVLFACDLLLEGTKKDNISITDTILLKLWKTVIAPYSPS
jgi:hypothetical protein